MVLTDIETIKKNEWERRRKLRIQQVRQQSKDLANKLRDRIRNEESKQISKTEQQRSTFLKKWETKRIDNLQKRYQECLEDVGQAHIQAAVQPDIDEFLKKEQEINRACATLRGQNALDRLRLEQQKCIESKTVSLERKKFIRGKEDYRSHLVASLPPPIPIPLARTNSSQSRQSSNNKRTSPFKKRKFAIKPKRRKPKVLSEIPSNLPDTTQKQNYFIFTGLSATQSKSNENNSNTETNKAPSVYENQLSTRQKGGEDRVIDDECYVKQYTKKHDEDLKIPANHNFNQNPTHTCGGTNRMINKDNLPLSTNCDINRNGESTHSCFQENKTSQNIHMSINRNLNEASLHNRNEKYENTTEGVRVVSKCHDDKTGKEDAQFDETCQQDPEYFVKCGCSNASMSDSSIDHKCAGYELNFYKENYNKSPKNRQNNRILNDNSSDNRHRSRRHSEAECYSDESFDSDVTWPPYTPRTRSHITKNRNQPVSSRVEYYDHNNRFHTSSCRSKPIPFVTKLHHLPSNIASAELERLAVENKVSKEELLNSKQSKRSEKAVERQRLRYDFQKLIDELSKLDKKERKLRYSAMQPSDKGVTTFGVTHRKEIMANRQKKMESAVEDMINSHYKEPEVLHLQKGFGNKNKTKVKHKDILEAEEVPQLNVAECQFIKKDSNPKRQPTTINTNVRESDNSSKNKLSLQNLMKRINEQREMLFNDIRNDNSSKELLLPFSDIEQMPRHKSHTRKEFINDSSVQTQPCNTQEDKSNTLQQKQKVRSSLIVSLPFRKRGGGLPTEISGHEGRRQESPGADDRDISWSQKMSPNTKNEINDSFENNQNIGSRGQYETAETSSPDIHQQESNLKKSFSSRTDESSNDSLKDIHLDADQSKTQAHRCPLHDRCFCQPDKTDFPSVQKEKIGLIKNQDKRNSEMEKENLKKSSKNHYKANMKNREGDHSNESNSVEEEIKKTRDYTESSQHQGHKKKGEIPPDGYGNESFGQERTKTKHNVETSVHDEKKRNAHVSNENEVFEQERRKSKQKLEKNLKKHEKQMYRPSQKNGAFEVELTEDPHQTTFHESDEHKIQHSQGNNPSDGKNRKSSHNQESDRRKQDKGKVLGTNEHSSLEQTGKNPEQQNAGSILKAVVQQQQVYDKAGKLKNQCIQDICKHHCACKHNQFMQISKVKRMQNDRDNDEQKEERNLRFPSPIPHCHTDNVTLKVHKENVGSRSKTPSGNTVDETDQNRDKKSNSSSEETGSTLYSLDMALSQLSMDSSHETSSSSFKGVRIVVKVSGQKQKDKCSKIKRKNIKKQTEEDCMHKELLDHQKHNCNHRQLLEDSCNQREQKNISQRKQPDQSAGSSSTSYLSPPDKLTPKQVDMLSGLFRKIQNQDDHKGIPLLKQYISRLLNMSRGSIDRLNVSSSDVSISSSIFHDDSIESSQNNMRTEYGRRIANESEEHHISSTKEIKQNQEANLKCKCSLLSQQEVSQKKSEKKRQPLMNQVMTKANRQQNRQGDLQSNLDSLRHQVNEYFESKKDSRVKASLETTDIVNKYAELAKMYAERMNCLAEMIGDMNTSEVIKKSMSFNHNNDTSYLSLPSETNVDVPVGNIEPCGCISPTYICDDSNSRQNENIEDKSWGHQLNASKTVKNTQTPIDLSHISTNILPAPPQIKKSDQTTHPSLCSFFDTKPPPTMLNGKMRICTPHELSTIQEVDTPTTSRIHVTARSQDCHPTSTTDVNDGNINNENTPLNDEMIEDINLSFLTLKSQEEEEEEEEDNEVQECSSFESVPDIMEELIRRGIISSPFSWAKEMRENKASDENLNEQKRSDHEDNIASCFTEDLSSSQMADEEVRGILKESSPEDIETDFKSLGIGWASTTLRKTRQANELSCDSSSSNEFNSSRTKAFRKPANITGNKIETSTPDNVRSGNKSGFVQLIPTSEPDISTVKLSSSSDNLLMLTPPDVSLRPNMRLMTLSNESIGSLS